MVTKIGQPPDPSTQFLCDGCGRPFNLDLKEPADGQSLCPHCFVERFPDQEATLPETKVKLRKEVALKKAQEEYDDAVNAEEAAIEKAGMPVSPPEVAPEGGDEEVDTVPPTENS